MNKTLILGLGSEILTDDGIGLRIVNDIKNHQTFQVHTDKFEQNLKGRKESRIDFKTCLTGSLDLLEIIKDYDILIILDATKTQNGIPGNVYRYSLKNYKDTIHLQNIHDISFQDTLKLGNRIGLKIPKKVEIFAIEIFDNLTFSSSLSAVLTNKYLRVLKEIKNQIEELTSQGFTQSQALTHYLK